MLDAAIAPPYRSLPPDLVRAGDTDLIAGFYAAASHARDWSAPWSELCSAFQADTGFLYRQSRPSAAPQIIAATNWPMPSATTRADRGAVPPPAHRSISVPVSPPGLIAALAFDAEDQATLRAFHVLRATIPLDGTALLGMGLHRKLAAPAFTEGERLALDGLGRHLASALRLEALLSAARSASAVRASVLDLDPRGLIVCTGAGGLVFANAAAGDIAEASILTLDSGSACLGGLPAPAAAKLQALIGKAAGRRASGCTRIIREAGMPALAALVEPLPLRMAEAEPALGHGKATRGLVLITLRDMGATTDAAPSHLIDLFGLTAAEAGIVPQLINGDSITQIARSRGVAACTVKAQTQKILAKTGAANLRALGAVVATIS